MKVFLSILIKLNYKYQYDYPVSILTIFVVFLDAKLFLYNMWDIIAIAHFFQFVRDVRFIPTYQKPVPE